jgi:antitoxin PrlF
MSDEMNVPKRVEQYEGTVVQVGNSRGMRLPAGFFSAHPEFREGKVKVTVVAEGQVLVSAVAKRRAGQRAEAADPVMAAFLKFVEREMVEHPESIVPADSDQLRRIGKLVEGVEAE